GPCSPSWASPPRPGPPARASTSRRSRTCARRCQRRCALRPRSWNPAHAHHPGKSPARQLASMRKRTSPVARSFSTRNHSRPRSTCPRSVTRVKPAMARAPSASSRVSPTTAGQRKRSRAEMSSSSTTRPASGAAASKWATTMRGSEWAHAATSRRARAYAPSARGGPAGSRATTACERTSFQPRSAVSGPAASKLTARGSIAASRARSSASDQPRPRRHATATPRTSLLTPGEEGRRRARRVLGLLVDGLGLGGDVAHDAVAGGGRHAVHEVDPGVRLHRLAHAAPAEVLERGAGARAAADVEHDVAALVAVGAEGDAPGLRVAGERGEREALRVAVDDAHVREPRPRDADVQLVAQLERAALVAVERGDLRGRETLEVLRDERHHLRRAEAARRHDGPVVALQERAVALRRGQEPARLSTVSLLHAY